MALHTLGNLDSMELDSFRKIAPSFEVGRPHLGPASLSTMSLVAAHRVEIRTSCKVSLEKRFESWSRGTDESNIYFEGDEDPEDVAFPYMWV
jgi:hypothetical protein